MIKLSCDGIFKNLQNVIWEIIKDYKFELNNDDTKIKVKNDLFSYFLKMKLEKRIDKLPIIKVIQDKDDFFVYVVDSDEQFAPAHNCKCYLFVDYIKFLIKNHFEKNNHIFLKNINQKFEIDEKLFLSNEKFIDKSNFNVFLNKENLNFIVILNSIVDFKEI